MKNKLMLTMAIISLFPLALYGESDEVIKDQAKKLLGDVKNKQEKLREEAELYKNPNCVRKFYWGSENAKTMYKLFSLCVNNAISCNLPQQSANTVPSKLTELAKQVHEAQVRLEEYEKLTVQIKRLEQERAKLAQSVK